MLGLCFWDWIKNKAAGFPAAFSFQARGIYRPSPYPLNTFSHNARIAAIRSATVALATLLLGLSLKRLACCRQR